MKNLLCGLLLLVSALAHSTLAGAASVVLGQAGPGGVSAIISPDPGEIGRPATIWMGGVLNGTLYLRDGPTNWAEYRGGPFPIALTSAALPSSMEVSIVNVDISSLPELDVYVGYGSTEADLWLSGHLAKVYTTVPTPAVTAVGVVTGSATSATIGAAGGSVSMPDGKIALTIPAGALASDTVISIQPLTNMAPGKIGAAYRLTPDGQTFLTPVTLTFTYTDEDLLGTAAEFLGAAFQTAAGYWQWAGDATVDTTAKTVSVSSNHFTDWSNVRGLQIRPARKIVKTNGTVGLQVRVCYSVDFGEELTSLGFDCDATAQRVVRSLSIDEWSVNGRPGGGDVFGTVSGSGATATYTAPSTKPIPNPVAVSAHVRNPRRGGTSRTLVSAVITIAEDSWTGTGSLTSDAYDTIANVTWTLERTEGNIAYYEPTGTATITAVHSACHFDPSDAPIAPGNGWLWVDYNANPPTYHGVGAVAWFATILCPGAPGFPAGAATAFLGSGTLEALGQVSADGATIEGSFAADTGTTVRWKFTRDR